MLSTRHIFVLSLHVDQSSLQGNKYMLKWSIRGSQVVSVMLELQYVNGYIIRATHAAHNILDFITVKMFGNNYELRTSSLGNFLPPSVRV